MKQIRLFLLFISMVIIRINVVGQEWKPVPGNLMTLWGSDVSPENAWKEYPRPQMVRDNWENLNGLWDYAVLSKDQPQPGVFDGKILVPFSIESTLSGVAKQIDLNDAIWYKRKFLIPEVWKNQRVLIHFEASDFETTVWLNGSFLGVHKGGYDHFSFDMTRFIVPGDKQELIVKVYDPQETIFRSVGKQSRQNKEYQNCSGIWQTVWLEPVPLKASVASVKIDPQLDAATLTTFITGDPEGLKVKYEIRDNNKIVASYISDVNVPFKALISKPKRWSPDSPFLYDLRVVLLKGNSVVDVVKSYLGLRTISRGKNSAGEQFLLNGKPIFQIGPLDQNYWPDGGLTPPSEAAMLWEAEYLKKIGCNMMRSHVKVNPQRYYYNADKLGLLIWQDFVCGPGADRSPSKEDSDFWLGEQKSMIESLYNHPSIVMWIVFNESWGEHDAKNIIEWAMEQDKSRFITGASGWIDVPQIGNIRDIHDYTLRPAIPVSETDSRILVLGESGGFASAVPPHNWTGRSNESGTPVNLLSGGFSPTVPRDTDTMHDIFRPTFTSGEPFAKQYSIFIDHINILRNSGLCSAVYTQMTDMKSEENGFLTFDRKVSKVDEARLAAIHSKLFTDPPLQEIIFPTSLKDQNDWETAIADYPEGMQRTNKSNPGISTLIQTMTDINSLRWTPAKGPFTCKDLNPGSEWDGIKQLFIRKSFKLNKVPQNATIRVYTTKHSGVGNFWMHSRLYVNGHFVADESTRQIMPEHRMAEVILPKQAIALLKKGDNQIIIQFIPGFNIRDAVFAPMTEKVDVDISLTSFSNIE
jgi:Glycosyl hydrolases family 2, sugar binding domain/Glycosyl hydrolases family 2/Glycosyl hydrolases family 2, TIM barrel domain